MLETEAELERLEGEMSRDAGEETMAAYAAAQQRLEAGGGYRWRDRVLEVLRGLGFDPEQAERPLSTFSGGELTRASLARALAAPPDLLLLDEPTNHLDIPSLEWLESYLVDLDAAVVLVAHDRWFLEAVGTSVLELEAQRAPLLRRPLARLAPGAGGAPDRPRQGDRAPAGGDRADGALRRALPLQGDEGAAGAVAGQADRAGRSATAPAAERRDTRRLRFSFKPPERPGRVVLETGQRQDRGAGADAARRAPSLEVERGEHVVLVGPNGGRQDDPDRDPGRAQREPASGSVRTGHNVKLGYLSQHADTAAGEGTVLDAAQRETGLSGPKARALLGGFLFSGADAEKQLSDISGGEQRRLSLAILVASGANVLILDEPTNHLDIESREALEDALTEFEGAVVLVSHDRALLEAVGSRTIVCEGGELQSHPSGWAEYQRRRDEREAAAAAAAKPAAPAGGRKYSATKPAQKAAKQGGPAGGADRAGRSGAARGRGGAGRPRGLGEPGPRRAGRRAPRAPRSGRSKSCSRSGRKLRPTAEVGACPELGERPRER